MTIPNIPQINTGIPRITVNGTGIPFISSPWTYNAGIRPVNNVFISELRPWEMSTQVTAPLDPPVVTVVGTPIIDMPGCVKVHKENAKRDPSTNKNLVNDDPKGNTTLCDAGMPSYLPVEYDSRELFWQTINTEPEDADEGVDTNDSEPIDAPAPPTPPPTPGETAGEVECPPLNARRIGDLNQAGTEKIKEYKLTVDGKRCETIWEPVPQLEQYLPSVGLVTTTATIATVATASALFAKPLADLLLKVVKPVVKKAIAKVQKMLGKNPRRPTLQEKRTDQYREKKGLLPMKKK